MIPNFKSAFDSIKNDSGKFLVLAGIGFLVLGLLFMSQVASSYYLISAIGLFLGLFLIGVGILTQIEFFHSFGFTGKLTSIFATASLGFFAGAFVSITYKVVTGFRYSRVRSHGEITPLITPLTDNPYAWLFFPLLIAGACFFVPGVILKIYSECS